MESTQLKNIEVQQVNEDGKVYLKLTGVAEVYSKDLDKTIEVNVEVSKIDISSADILQESRTIKEITEDNKLLRQYEVSETYVKFKSLTTGTLSVIN